MDTGHSILLPTLGALFASWLGLSIFVLVSRALHDRRRARIEAAADGEHGNLRRLPWRRSASVSLLAADAAAPVTEEVERAAKRAVRENRDRLVRAASSHRGELRRWHRVDALRVLARAGDPEALRLLEKAVADGDADLAGAAVDIIGSIDRRPAAELLVRILRDGSYSRSRVASHLDSRAVPIDDLLLPLLDAASPGARFWAATLLSGYASAARVGSELAAHAADPDANVRAAVAESLAGTGPSAARDRAVHELLADPVWYVRVHAARTAGSLGLESQAPTLIEMLADREWWVRSAAKDGLAALGAAAHPALISALGHADRFARNGAAETLDKTGYVDALVAVVLDGPEPRRRDDLDMLRRIVDAGGTELRRSVLARCETSALRERLEQLLADGQALSEAA